MCAGQWHSLGSKFSLHAMQLVNATTTKPLNALWCLYCGKWKATKWQVTGTSHTAHRSRSNGTRWWYVRCMHSPLTKKVDASTTESIQVMRACWKGCVGDHQTVSGCRKPRAQPMAITSTRLEQHEQMCLCVWVGASRLCALKCYAKSKHGKCDLSR